MNKKICFITSLFSHNIELVDKPSIFKKNMNYDYFLFTNFNPKKFKTSWDIIQTNFDFDKTNNLIYNFYKQDNKNFTKNKNKINKKIIENFFKNNVIKSRYPKFMAWKFIKQITDNDYDIIIYCDAFLSPKFDFDWSKIYKQLTINNDNKNNRINLIQSYHHYDKVRFGGIIEDCKLIISAEKDEPENIIKTLSYFKKNKIGGVKLQQNNYVVNTVLAYNLKCNKTLDFLQSFWNLYRCPGFSIRDQPIWNYLLIKKNIKPIIFEKVIQNNDKNTKNANEIIHMRNKGTLKKDCFYSMKDDIFSETGEYIGHNIYNYS